MRDHPTIAVGPTRRNDGALVIRRPTGSAYHNDNGEPRPGAAVAADPGERPTRPRRSAGRDDPRRRRAGAATVAASGDVFGDAQYPSLARQYRLYLELAFAKRNTQPGGCAPPHRWLATRLGISRQRVQENQNRLVGLGLIEVMPRQGQHRANQVYVLPRVPGPRRQQRKAVLAQAWRFAKLQLPFRVQWLIEETAYQGAAVRLSLADLAVLTGAERHNVWRAIERNKVLGRLLAEVTGEGRNRVYDFTVSGTATPLRRPTMIVIDGGGLPPDATRAEAHDWLMQQVFDDADTPKARRRR